MARRFSWIVLTNCAPGAEARFERWYDEVHVPDLLRVPGIVAVRRGRLAPAQTMMVDGGLVVVPSPERSFRYLAVYSFEAESSEAVLGEVSRRANTPEMPISPDLREVETMLYEDL